jgi:tellurite resistance protein TerB
MALEWLKQRFNEVSTNLKSEVTKFQNKTFLESVVAGCVLVAYADGVVRPEEKQKMMGFLRNNEVLSAFSSDEVIALFDKYAKQFEFDYQIGQANALQGVAKIKDKSDQARLMVRVCCVIGAADGSFDDNEKEAVRKICAELNLNPKDFDLT